MAFMKLGATLGCSSGCSGHQVEQLTEGFAMLVSKQVGTGRFPPHVRVDPFLTDIFQLLKGILQE